MYTKDVVLFGAGNEGKKALSTLGSNRVAFFVDNNKNIIGSFIDEIEIISIEKLVEINRESKYNIVITSSKSYMEINQKLNACGFRTLYSFNKFLIYDALQNYSTNKRIVLMNTHAGTNIGDHFITNAELVFFGKYLPDYTIVEIPANLIDEEIDYIGEHIQSSDIIAISGGGYMGSLWLIYGEENTRKIVTSFPQNKIIVFPQTLYFEENESGQYQLQISKEIYNAHRNLSLCLRETKSYEIAKEYFGESVECYRLPDMVTVMNCCSIYTDRLGVGVCFRKDKEGVLSEAEKREILDVIDCDVSIFDMHTDMPVTKREREQLVFNFIYKIKKYELVITDRLHCMLICAITGTPCMAFDNLTKKISGVYEWIQMNDYIHVVRCSNDAKNYIKKYINNTKMNIYNQNEVIKKFEEMALLFKGD